MLNPVPRESNKKLDAAFQAQPKGKGGDSQQRRRQNKQFVFEKSISITRQKKYPVGQKRLRKRESCFGFIFRIVKCRVALLKTICPIIFNNVELASNTNEILPMSKVRFGKFESLGRLSDESCCRVF